MMRYFANFIGFSKVFLKLILKMISNRLRKSDFNLKINKRDIFTGDLNVDKIFNH